MNPRADTDGPPEGQKRFGGRGLQLPRMVDTLKKTITSLPPLLICSDAIREYTPKHRRELLKSLREIIRVSPGARVFFTGRLHIDHGIVGCFSEVLRIPLGPKYSDNKSYLEMRVGGNYIPNSMDDKLRADIMRIIPEKISER